MNVNSILSKYKNVLGLYNPNKINHEELAQIIERCVSLIKTNYNYDTQHKIAGVFIIVKLFLESKSFNITQIEDLLKGFFIYYDEEYVNYIDSLVLIKDRFDADLSFYYNFINKEKILHL